MAKCKKEIDIKKFINEYNDAKDNGLRGDELFAIPKKIVTELRKHKEFAQLEDDCTFDDMLAALDDHDESEFNYCLDRVFDVADEKRIWMGL